MDKTAASGSLTVVGTGIQFAGQVTTEARAYIEHSDKVLYVVADAATIYWISKLNPTAESLHTFYKPGQDRAISYLGMVERTLACLHEGLNTCVVSYGHPGVFAYPMHESVRRARAEGYPAKMLPGISAEDCLYADLGVDPGQNGCQSFEATDFLVRKRKFDIHSSLILWQIAVVGEIGYKPIDGLWNSRGLQILIEVLCNHYDPTHEVVVYQAAQYPFTDHVAEHVHLAKVPKAKITPLSTLYVPPKAPATPDVDILDRLGIPISHTEETPPEPTESTP
jgi:precorrin-3B methylase